METVEASAPTLVLTDAAAKKVGDLIHGEGNPKLMLRVFVQGGERAISGRRRNRLPGGARRGAIRDSQSPGFDHLRVRLVILGLKRS
jgi:hypothetical protein